MRILTGCNPQIRRLVFLTDARDLVVDFLSIRTATILESL